MDYQGVTSELLKIAKGLTASPLDQHAWKRGRDGVLTFEKEMNGGNLGSINDIAAVTARELKDTATDVANEIEMASEERITFRMGHVGVYPKGGKLYISISAIFGNQLTGGDWSTESNTSTNAEMFYEVAMRNGFRLGMPSVGREGI